MTQQISDFNKFEAGSDEQRRLLREESFILEVIEGLSEALSAEGITRADLAKKLGKSKGFVSQILAGGRNLTLRTVADVSDALGHVPQFHLVKDRHAEESFREHSLSRCFTVHCGGQVKRAEFKIKSMSVDASARIKSRRIHSHGLEGVA